ncbi:hypothetical protein F5877DRAFT_73430, partial [Lentinula edodes]
DWSRNNQPQFQRPWRSYRGVDAGEWLARTKPPELIPSLGMGRIPEAGDQVNSEIEPGLYSGLSRSSRARIETSTPDHPAVQFGQQKHTSIPPDAGSNAAIRQSLYLVSVEDKRGLDILDSPREFITPVIHFLLESRVKSRVGLRFQLGLKDDEDSLDFDVHFHTSVSTLSATPATLASPSTVSSSLQELKATLNNGVDVIVISIESGSGLQKGGERSPTSGLTIPSPKSRLSDSAALEVPRPGNPFQKAKFKGIEKKKKKKQVPANRCNWPLGSSEDRIG